MFVARKKLRNLIVIFKKGINKTHHNQLNQIEKSGFVTFYCNMEQAFGEEVIPIKVVLCNVCQNKFILLYPYDFVNISTLLNGIERAGR
jgi:hypothetical protein